MIMGLTLAFGLIWASLSEPHKNKVYVNFGGNGSQLVEKVCSGSLAVPEH